jgi:hypothetical protein
MEPILRKMHVPEFLHWIGFTDFLDFLHTPRGHIFCAFFILAGIVQIVMTFLPFAPMVRRKKHLLNLIPVSTSKEEEMKRKLDYDFHKRTFFLWRVFGLLLIALGVYGIFL